MYNAAVGQPQGLALLWGCWVSLLALYLAPGYRALFVLGQGKEPDMALTQGLEARMTKLMKELESLQSELQEGVGSEPQEPKTTKAMGKVVGRTRGNRAVYEGKLSHLPENTPVEMGVARDGSVWARIPFGTRFARRNGKLVLVK
jgi:hypothetical protein